MAHQRIELGYLLEHCQFVFKNNTLLSLTDIAAGVFGTYLCFDGLTEGKGNLILMDGLCEEGEVSGVEEGLVEFVELGEIGGRECVLD